jgi:Kef-type K+ transport system membrane component KefB
VNLNQGLADLVAVGLVAVLAPLVVALLPGPRIPQVVIFLVGGVLIGPHVLGLAETSAIQLLANVGLGFLFLLAGYELDPALLRQRPGKLAMVGWAISAVIAVGVAAGLTDTGYIRDYVPVGLALTTTALGTLLPILRDNDMLGGQFGRYVFAAGAVGELFPILIIAVFLTRRGHFIALASVALVGVLALALTAGMSLDLKAIARDPLRLLIFFLMLLVVRGLPSLLVYRRALPTRQRVEMTFITATTLPLLIALADIGQQDGVMLPATAAALVGAGVLAVLVYRLIVVTLHRSAPLTPADVAIPAAGSADGTSPAPGHPEPGDQGDQSPHPLGLPAARRAAGR